MLQGRWGGQRPSISLRRRERGWWGDPRRRSTAARSWRSRRTRRRPQGPRAWRVRPPSEARSLRGQRSALPRPDHTPRPQRTNPLVAGCWRSIRRISSTEAARRLKLNEPDSTTALRSTEQSAGCAEPGLPKSLLAEFPRPEEQGCGQVPRRAIRRDVRPRRRERGFRRRSSPACGR